MILAPFKWIVALFFNWSNALFNDPGWAVVGMSVLLSLLLTPLYVWIERRKNSDKAKGAPMQAEIDKIEAVYTGRERFYYTREIQRRYKYSPWTAMIPTLGLLVQIPFLLAAYHYLSELPIFNGAAFWYIKDLSKPDTIATVAGLPINLLAILMTVINLVSGWRYAESGKIKERIQYMAVAAIFLFLLYNCAASVVLYWTLSNALSFARSEIFFRQKGASVAPLAVENVIIIARWVCVCFLLLAVILAIDAELLRGLTGAGLVCCIKKLYFGVALGIIVPALVVGCVSIWRFKNGVALPYAFNVTFFFFIMSLLTPIVADVASFPIESVPLIAYFSRMGFAFATVFSVVLLVLSGGTAFPMATSVASRMAYDVNCTLGFLFAISIALQIFVCGPVCSFASCPEVATDVTVGSLLWQGLLRLAILVGVTYVVLKFMPVGIARIFLVALQIAFVVLFVNGNLIPYDYGVLFQGSYSKAASIVPECWQLVLEALVFVGLFLTAGKLVRFIDRNYKLVRFMLILIVLSFIVRTGYAIIRTTKVSAQAISEDAQNDEKLFRFSKTGKNVVFLLLDSFVGQRFGPLLDSDMSLKKTFDGFTWYPVTISASWFTFPNVPAMWAGEEYFPWRLGKTRKLGDVFNEAWNTYQQNVHSREYRFATSTRAQGYGCKILDAERTYHEMAYKRGQANETLQKSVNLESLKGNSLLHAVPLALRSIIYDSGHWNMDDRKATAYDATFNFFNADTITFSGAKSL